MGNYIGSFLGGLSQGFNNGVDMSNKIKAINASNEADSIRKQALIDAQAQRQADIDNQLNVVPVGDAPTPFDGSQGFAQQAQDAQTNQPALINPALTQSQQFNPASQGILGGIQSPNLVNPDVAQANAMDSAQSQPIAAASTAQNNPLSPASIAQTNGMGPIGTSSQNLKWKVGDKTFDSRDDAQKAAAANVQDQSAYFAKNAGNRLYNFYLQQGDIDKAKSWQDFAKSESGSQAMKLWASGYTKAKTGDWDGAANDFGRYYTNFVNDGQDYTGHKVLKDADGNTTGFTIDLKDKASGKTSTIPLSTDDLVQLSNMTNPQTLHDTVYQQQQLAQKAKMDMALKDHESVNKLAGEITLENLKNTHQIKQSNNKSVNDQAAKVAELTTAQQLKNAAPGKIATDANDLKDLGFSDEAIKAYINRSQSGEVPSDEKVRLELYNNFSKDQLTKIPMPDGKGGTTKIRWQDMSPDQKNSLLSAGLAMVNKKSSATGSVANPFTQNPASTGFVTVYDSKTGKNIVMPRQVAPIVPPLVTQ